MFQKRTPVALVVSPDLILLPRVETKHGQDRGSEMVSRSQQEFTRDNWPMRKTQTRTMITRSIKVSRMVFLPTEVLPDLRLMVGMDQMPSPSWPSLVLSLCESVCFCG